MSDMTNGGMPKPGGGLQNWQRANLVAAINFLGEIIGRSPTDVRARVVYEGLLEVLDPSRRAARSQSELAQASRTAAPKTGSERRRAERRRGSDRRGVRHGPPAGIERRSGIDRRTGADRRKRRA